MKLPLFILALFSTFLGFAGVNNSFVVLVGISHYKHDWNRINGANDVAYLSQFYKEIGIPADQITELVNENATKKNFLSTLDRTMPVHINELIIHLSTHGIQLPDENKDETDGLDEAFVLYDSEPAINYKTGSSAVQSFLIDDEVDFLIKEIQLKNPHLTHITVVLDACHSGTGARSFNTIRGGYPPLGNVVPVIKDESYQYTQENIHTTVLTASAARELNSEYSKMSMGSLTYCFIEAVKKLSINGSVPLLDLFYQIKAEFKSIDIRQNPLMEGNKTAILFDGAETALYRPEFEIQRRINDSTLQISGGSFSFINKKSVFELRSRNTSKSNFLSTARVLQINNTSTIIRVKNLISQAMLIDVKVTLDNPSATLLPLSVQLEEVEPSFKQYLTSKFREFNFTSTSNETGIDLAISQSKAQNRIVTNNGDTLYGNNESKLPCIKTNSTNFQETCVRILEQIYVYKNLIQQYKQLNANQLTYKFAILRKNEDNTYSTENPLSDIRFSHKDKCLLQLQNPNLFGGYVYLIAFDPNYCIQLLYGSSDETYIERGSGSSLLIPSSQLTGSNRYTLKLVFSEQPLGAHLNWLINNVVGTRGLEDKSGPFDEAHPGITETKARGAVQAQKSKLSISNFEIKVE